MNHVPIIFLVSMIGLVPKILNLASMIKRPSNEKNKNKKLALLHFCINSQIFDILHRLNNKSKLRD